MQNRDSKPATIVVHDDSVIGEATIEAMKKRGLAFRETTWSELDLANALGFVTIPPTHGETASLVVRRARRVLDAAHEQGARIVQCHHPGALGRFHDSSPLDAESRANVDTWNYVHLEYVREMEIYRYLERGLHVIPVVIGHCMSSDGSNDWRLREGLEYWNEFIHLSEREMDVSMPSAVAGGIVSALQQARPGRRYVFGGAAMEHTSIADVLGIRPRGPIGLTDLDRFHQRLARIFPKAQKKLLAGLEPFLFGPVLDSTRARGELGYMPRGPIFS